MERDEFIKSLGLGLALICTGSCMSGCTKADDNPEKGGTATVDLANQLLAIGEQITANGVLFFRIAAGNKTTSFVATEAVCPHQGGNLVWKEDQNKIQCQLHFSEYGTNGAVLQGPQNSSGNTRTLKIYNTTINGTTLTANIA